MESKEACIPVGIVLHKEGAIFLDQCDILQPLLSVAIDSDLKYKLSKRNIQEVKLSSCT